MKSDRALIAGLPPHTVDARRSAVFNVLALLAHLEPRDRYFVIYAVCVLLEVKPAASEREANTGDV